MTEKQLHGVVVELATTLGFRHYFTYRSKRSPSGWPDLALLRERLILVELKSAVGRLSEAQRGWLDALMKAGLETYVVRPTTLQALAEVLAHRGPPGVVGYELREQLREELG